MHTLSRETVLSNKKAAGSGFGTHGESGGKLFVGVMFFFANDHEVVCLGEYSLDHREQPLGMDFHSKRTVVFLVRQATRTRHAEVRTVHLDVLVDALHCLRGDIASGTLNEELIPLHCDSFVVTRRIPVCIISYNNLFVNCS